MPAPRPLNFRPVGLKLGRPAALPLNEPAGPPMAGPAFGWAAWRCGPGAWTAATPDTSRWRSPAIPLPCASSGRPPTPGPGTIGAAGGMFAGMPTAARPASGFVACAAPGPGATPGADAGACTGAWITGWTGAWTGAGGGTYSWTAGADRT